jgi:hypothetical protein
VVIVCIVATVVLSLFVLYPFAVLQSVPLYYACRGDAGGSMKVEGKAATVVSKIDPPGRAVPTCNLCHWNAMVRSTYGVIVIVVSSGLRSSRPSR